MHKVAVLQTAFDFIFALMKFLLLHSPFVLVFNSHDL